MIAGRVNPAQAASRLTWSEYLSFDTVSWKDAVVGLWAVTTARRDASPPRQ